MEDVIIKALAGSGPVGIIAALLFWFYRQDRKDSEARAERSEQRLEKIGTDFKETVESNTAAMTKICTVIELRGGNGNGRHV